MAITGKNNTHLSKLKTKAAFLTFLFAVSTVLILNVEALGADRSAAVRRDTLTNLDTVQRQDQRTERLPDSLGHLADSLLLLNELPGMLPDTLVLTDTISGPTLPPASGSNSTQEQSSLQAAVNILARDSQWMDIRHNMTYLYREAKIKYMDFELSADYIRIDHENNEVFASGLVDHNGRYVGRPVVIMGGDSPKAVDSLTYNFDTGVGVTYGVFSEVDGGFIQANRVRRNQFNEMSLFHGMYSTCNLPEPHTHFGIFIKKGIVTESQIVAGPAYLVVEGVHLQPLMIPFGFFPKPDKKASGFIFPSFGEDFSRGFYMRDAGFYFAFNDYWDSEVRGTLYSKGSYEASLRTTYRVRYKYDGGFNLRFASTRTGIEGTPGYRPTNDFNITWNHSQRPEANPGTTLSASVNFGTGSYFQNTAAGASYNYEQMTQNNMSSSISYGRRFGDGRFNFSASMSHRQDITTGSVYLELPSFNLNATTFNPFDSKDRIGEQKWYQKITVGYSLMGRNSIQTTEQDLFKRKSLGQFRNGFQHSVPISLSLNALKHFQVNTSVNYVERWYLQTIRRRLENTPAGYQEVRDTVQGFSRAYDYSVSSGLSTKFYGMYPRMGRVEAMRHVVTPSVNINYRPDFSDDLFGFYRNFVDAQGNQQQYSIFQDGIFGSPGSGKSMGIGFSINNNLEAKVRSRRDTTDGGIKKVQIIQGLTFNGNYNMAADSFRLSNISFSGRTALFNQQINVNFNGTFDPYSVDEQGRRIHRFAIKDGKLARLTNFGLSFDYSLNPKMLQRRNEALDGLEGQRGNMTPEQQQALARISSDPNAFVDFNIPWNLAGSFSFQYSRFGNVSNITSTLNVFGDFSFTEKWKVQFNSGYDFKQKKISLTRFSIYRDLHCWDMSVGWVPFGQYQSYNITIRAKASILQDLKLTKRNEGYNR